MVGGAGQRARKRGGGERESHSRRAAEGVIFIKSGKWSKVCPRPTAGVCLPVCLFVLCHDASVIDTVTVSGPAGPPCHNSESVSNSESVEAEETSEDSFKMNTVTAVD